MHSVKLCVHFVSVCLKVQKWTQTDTKVEVFEFAVSTNEILRKVTTDQSEA